MAEIVYCDDYEAITGKKPEVEAKVVEAPKKAAKHASDVQVETKDAE